jgi:uncharacterized membrane protein
MKAAGSLAETLAPWAGLVVGLVTTAIVHQFGSEGTFNHCATTSPLPVLLIGLLGTLVTAAAGFLSWQVVRRPNEGASRRLVATISVGAAALFVMTMLLPMIAALVLPPCFE